MARDAALIVWAATSGTRFAPAVLASGMLRLVAAWIVMLCIKLRFLLLFFLYSAFKGCGCLLRCIFLILLEGMLGFVKMDEWMDGFTYD